MITRSQCWQRRKQRSSCCSTVWRPCQKKAKESGPPPRRSALPLHKVAWECAKIFDYGNLGSTWRRCGGSFGLSKKGLPGITPAVEEKLTTGVVLPVARSSLRIWPVRSSKA